VFLHHDPCGPAAAFYWAAAALERPPDDRAVRDVECVWSARVHERLPAVNAFELPGGLLAVTVRGTTTAADVMADAAVRRFSWSSFERKARRSVSDGEAAGLVEADLAEGRRYNFAFHQGFYVLAAKALGPMLDVIRTRRPKRVVFYGHSLGGAVASFMYRWVRAAFAGQTTLKIDVRLAVLSSPAICDERCFDRWFGPLGDDGMRARHYFTTGDVVILRLPGIVSFDRHATRAGEYVARPWVEFERSTRERGIRARVRRVVAATLLAHVTLVPGTLRNTINGMPPPRLTMDCGGGEDVVFAFSNAKITNLARSLLRANNINIRANIVSRLPGSARSIR
jgi:hypothetical protein